jgi:hypothetical protein
VFCEKIPNLELDADASRPNLGLDVDASRPNLEVGVDALRWGWVGVSQHIWVIAKGLIILGLRQDSIALGPRRTRLSWVRRHNPSSMGLPWPNFIGSWWKILNILIFNIIKSITIKNSIICAINILIFIIIKSINIKNSIICVINILNFIIIKSINSKNSIIYVINIFIFLITKSIIIKKK